MINDKAKDKITEINQEIETLGEPLDKIDIFFYCINFIVFLALSIGALLCVPQMIYFMINVIKLPNSNFWDIVLYVFLASGELGVAVFCGIWNYFTLKKYKARRKTTIKIRELYAAKKTLVTYIIISLLVQNSIDDYMFKEISGETKEDILLKFLDDKIINIEEYKLLSK